MNILQSLQDEHLTASTHSQIVTCDRLEFQTVEVSVGAKTSEDVLMPDYEPTARVSENTDNGHNLTWSRMLERMGMCQVI